MTQNFVKVSQEHKHIVVKNAGGLRGVAGPQGPQGIQGPQGPAGPQGIQGPQGPAGEAGPAGPQGIQGIQGEKGDTGATGPQGPQGPAGAGLVITGSVDTYAELPSTLGPSDAGKAYFVQDDGKLYVWTGTAWPAEGEGAQFEGPQGPTGATGATGATGPAGADGYSPTATVAKSGDTATITITDKNGTTTAQVSDGTDGAPGADGFSPIATVSKVGTTTTISITDEQGTTTATVNDGVIPTIDSALSTSSENPVQNKVITNKLNDAAFVGTEVVGGTSLIDTSDIAPSAITTTKIADGAVTSDKIDWTTLQSGEIDPSKIDWASLQDNVISVKALLHDATTMSDLDTISGFKPGVFQPFIVNGNMTATLNGSTITSGNCRAYGLATNADGNQVFSGILFITYCPQQQFLGKVYVKIRHGSFGTAGWRQITMG